MRKIQHYSRDRRSIFAVSVHDSDNSPWLPTLMHAKILFSSDINQPCTIVLSVLMQSKSTMAGLVRPQESHVGKYEIHANMQPKAKQLHRIRLSADCDVMAVYGTYVSTDARVLLESRRIHAAFITVYIRGRATPVRFTRLMQSKRIRAFNPWF